LVNIAAVLLSTISGHALAVPAFSSNSRSFTLPAIYNETFVQNFVADLRKRQDSPSFPANYTGGLFGGMYTTPMTLGGNQVLNIQFDTSTADL
jgi:hypothetical protein